MVQATQSKLVTLLQSRKFWSLIAALVSLGVAYQTGQMPLPQVELGVVAALSGYAIATGIEDNGQAQARVAPSTTTVNLTTPGPAPQPVPLDPSPPGAPIQSSTGTTASATVISAGVTTGRPSVTQAGPYPVIPST